MSKHDEARRAFLEGRGGRRGSRRGRRARARRARADARAAQATAPATDRAGACAGGRPRRVLQRRQMPPPSRRSPSGSCPARRASPARATPTCSITSISRSPAPMPICRISTGAGSPRSTRIAARPTTSHSRSSTRAKQDEVITRARAGQGDRLHLADRAGVLQHLRTHTMEGMFADPVYGGNKDFAGWRLVGFPGAQPVFTPADMQSKEAFTRAPIIGLQAQAKARRGGDEPWQPKKPMSSSSASARPAAFSRPSSARPA